MPWFPSYKISAGLLAGRQSPEGGSLQGLWDFPSVSRTTSGNIRLANRADFSGDDWDGAFGTSILDDLLNHAMASYESGNLGSWYLLAQIDVENPEGAQYYKQAYVIEALDDGGSSYVTNTVTYGGNEYTCKWFRAIFSFRVSRFEWATPTAAYTRTDLSTNSSRNTGTACKVVQGGTDDFYYAFTGGWLFDKIYLSLGSFTDNNNIDCFGVSLFCWKSKSPTYREQHPNPVDRKSFGLIGQTLTYLNQLFGEFKLDEKEDPNEDDDGDSGEGGGDGDHDKTEDPIPIPPAPEIGAADAGFLTLYKMTVNEINAFAQEMNSPTVWQAIKDYFMDPLDFITGISLVPFNPPTTRTAKPAFFTSETLYGVITDEFVGIDCGSIAFPKFYNSAFDFNPFSRYTLFLPYIGYRDLDADEVAGEIIKVFYRCDCLTGDCVAFVAKVNPMMTQVIAQFSGNCGVRVPYGRVSYDAAIAAGISLLGGAVGMGVGMAASAAGLQGGEITAGQLANQVSSATVSGVNGGKVTTERSGTAGASAGYMSKQKPHLIRNIPHQSLPKNYRHLNGYPSNIGGTLSQFHGFTAVESIELTGIGATDAEKEEILSLMQRGIYL